MAVAGLLAACGGGVQLAGNVAPGPAPDAPILIEAGDNYFKPDTVALNPGDEVTVQIDNVGARPHDWTVDALTLSTGIMAPEEVFHATFTVPAGDIEFVCTLHRGMKGTIKVA